MPISELPSSLFVTDDPESLRNFLLSSSSYTSENAMAIVCDALHARASSCAVWLAAEFFSEAQVNPASVFSEATQLCDAEMLRWCLETHQCVLTDTEAVCFLQQLLEASRTAPRSFVAACANCLTLELSEHTRRLLAESFLLSSKIDDSTFLEAAATADTALLRQLLHAFFNFEYQLLLSPTRNLQRFAGEAMNAELLYCTRAEFVAFQEAEIPVSERSRLLQNPTTRALLRNGLYELSSSILLESKSALSTQQRRSRRLI